MKRFTVCLLTFGFYAIMIAELSSALIIQSHSNQIKLSKENIPEIGTKILKNWFHRQIVFGSFKPIIDTYFPPVFKKKRLSFRSRFTHNCPSKP